MKRTLLLVIALSFVLGGEVFPQLKLKTEIVGHYYCPGDNDLDGLSLNLKLKYTNVGSQAIILSRDSSEIGQVVVSKNNNGSVGIREMNAMLEWMSSGERKATAADLRRLFVILKPKETYETKTATRVWVFRANRSGIAGAVGNGKHFLQLLVSTWTGSLENADQLRESWKGQGKLWTMPVMSEPMPITVAMKRTLVKCR